MGPGVLIWGPCWVLFLGGLGAEGCLQQLKDANHDGWLGPGRADGRVTFAIHILFTAFEGGQQQLNHASHDGWLEPGRWPTAAKKRDSRRKARARACRREAQIRNPYVIYTLGDGQQQLKDARGVCGEGAWSGGRGFVIDNPKQIKLSHMPRYIVEQCAADCKRCAGTAALLRILEFNM